MNALILIGVLGAATIGGVFFAFSTFVMRALAQLPPAHGVAAMQRINVVVLNPLFLGVFIGTALVQGMAAGLSVVAWVPQRSPLLLAGAAFYLIGTFGVTAGSTCHATTAWRACRPTRTPPAATGRPTSASGRSGTTCAPWPRWRRRPAASSR